MSVIAIGDIHGNSNALDDLLEQVIPEMRSGDTLVFLGDYIDRGPNSKGCIERILRLKRESPFPVVTLMGNHEQCMLRSLSDITRHSWLIAMDALETIKSYSEEVAVQLQQALDEYGARLFTVRIPLPYCAFFDAMPTEHLEFFQHLQTYYRDESVICVHAGFDPDGTLDPLNTDICMWGSTGFPEEYSGADTIIYGHWNNATVGDDGSVQPCILPNRTYGIDTISHGVLTALRLPDGKIFQSGKDLPA
jgi:serine/threonine protein phosphatase 1